MHWLGWRHRKGAIANSAAPCARKRAGSAQGDQLSVEFRRVQIVQFSVLLPAERCEVAWPFIFLGLQMRKGSVCKTGRVAAPLAGCGAQEAQ